MISLQHTSRRTLLGAALVFTACSPDTPVNPASVPRADLALPAFNNHFAFMRTQGLTTTEHPYSDSFHDATVWYQGVGSYRSIFSGTDMSLPVKDIIMEGSFRNTRAQCVSGPAALSLNQIDYNVRCMDLATGVSVNSPYSTVVVGASSLVGTMSFALFDQPTVRVYNPPTARSHTTGNGAISATRAAVGDWFVNMGTGSPHGTMYQVAPAQLGVVCSIAGFMSYGIHVRCFDRSGTPVDAPFKVLQVSRGRPARAFGFLWANHPPPPFAYRPTHAFFTSTEADVGTVDVHYNALGMYTVAFTGVVPPQFVAENILVTPYGDAFAACAVADTSQVQSTVTGKWIHYVQVHCRDAQGRFMDSRFAMTLIGQ
jgi:hypothetical protein